MPNTEESRGQRTCPACMHVNRPTANYCEYCGEQLPEQTICPQCGEECNKGQLFCHACGYSLTSEPPQGTTTPRVESSLRDAEARPDSGPLNRLELRGLYGRAATTIRASAFWGQVRLLLAPSPTGLVGMEEPAAGSSATEAVIPVSPEQIANLVRPELYEPTSYGAYSRSLSPSEASGYLSTDKRCRPSAFTPLQSCWPCGLFVGALSSPCLQPSDHGWLKRMDAWWLSSHRVLPGAISAWSLERLLTDPDRPPDLFWLLHLASLLLLVGCVFLARRFGTRQAENVPREGGAIPPQSAASNLTSYSDSAAARWTTGQRLLVIFIVCIGFFMRVYELPEFPPGTWYDEATAGLEAQRILSEPGLSTSLCRHLDGTGTLRLPGLFPVHDTAQNHICGSSCNGNYRCPFCSRRLPGRKPVVWTRPRSCARLSDRGLALEREFQPYRNVQHSHDTVCPVRCWPVAQGIAQRPAN